MRASPAVELQAPVAERPIALPKFGQHLLPSEGAMTVRISISWVRQTGTVVTPKGEVSLWRVSFQLDGDYFLATMVTIEVAGPQDALGAQREALSIFHRFAREIGGAAEHFQPFSN